MRCVVSHADRESGFTWAVEEVIAEKVDDKVKRLRGQQFIHRRSMALAAADAGTPRIPGDPCGSPA
jgi:hypothetical protein